MAKTSSTKATTNKSSVKARAPKAARRPTAPAPEPRYHHGGLREALLKSAETILATEGLEGLTLRAVARAAGVSHAAPKNHFEDLRALLSDLAAVGYQRFADALSAAGPTASGKAYVQFARQNPSLFLLMFRGERLDFERPALSAASQAAFAQLSGGATERREPIAGTLTLPQGAALTLKWATAHGLAMLAIDGRLDTIICRLPKGTTETMLFNAISAATAS